VFCQPSCDVIDIVSDAPKTAAYHIVGLTKLYPHRERAANADINLRVSPGEIFGLLGDNGAGKSTLVRQLVGLLRPSSGQIQLFGRDVTSEPAFVAQNVGYMPQSAFALSHLRVREAIYYSAHLRGLSRRAAQAECSTLIERWGLGEVADRVSRQLSGGQRRLLQIAVAMAGGPPVLVLDEPTNDLDPQRRRLVWEVLREYNREGNTIIFITHDVAEAEKVIQRVGIMRRGRLVALGRPSELKSEVDRKLRLELAYPAETEPVLPAGIEWTKRDHERWFGYLEAHQVNKVLADLDLAQVEDFRLHSATLEDLYLHFAEKAPTREALRCAASDIASVSALRGELTP
jgi:ABC-2 type transport system ATP-binding protein